MDSFLQEIQRLSYLFTTFDFSLINKRLFLYLYQDIHFKLFLQIKVCNESRTHDATATM